MGFLIRAVVNALAIWLATEIVPGIEAGSVTTVVVAALVLGLVNAIVRPVLLVLTLPLTLVTLGLFLFVLNALCLWLTSAIVPGFEVRGFWPAFWGALIVSALSWVVNGFVSDRGRVVVITEPERPALRR
jgi:putative membrane protein